MQPFQREIERAAQSLGVLLLNAAAFQQAIYRHQGPLP
jgi:hypothetical protein